MSLNIYEPRFLRLSWIRTELMTFYSKSNLTELFNIKPKPNFIKSSVFR